MIVDDSPAVRALVTLLRRICANLPGAEEYVMVHHPAFRVGKKPFAIAGMESATKGATVSINLGHEMQHQLLDDARFSRTPYIGQHGWVTIAKKDLGEDELRALVVGSYRRVANKKQLAELDGCPPTRGAGKAGAEAKRARKASK
jgi:predicted DNA-binding protein (MmcQ/YjbR family)